MRIVSKHAGAVELRWSWLPYWLGVSPAMKRDVDRMVRDAVLLNSVELTEAGLDRFHDYVVRMICRRFPIPGLKSYLDAIKSVEEPLT
jgi:hypothetical protein